MALISSSVCLSSFTPASLPQLQSSDSCSPSIVSRQPHVVCSFHHPPPPPPPSSGSINGLLRLHSPRKALQIVRMAPEEEKMTRRSPLDFPIEWERPKPGRRPDIFPQFSPMKTPLPPPLPCDPPEEDEEEDEEKKEEEEEDPGKEEDPEKPDQ